MSKKPTKTKPSTARLDAAQVNAIERLLAAQENTEAVQRLNRLIQQFPDHNGLRRLLVEALEHRDGIRAAGLAAYEWAEHRPNSVQAQKLFLSYAIRLGHVLLANRVARRLRALGMATPGFPVKPDVLADHLKMPDRTLATTEQIEQFDIGTLYLNAQNFAGAIRRLDDLDILPARNNRAMALFHLGRIDEALTNFMAGWEVDADNLFALGWAARLRLYRGDEAGAQGLTIPLAAATARRLDDALLQLDALLLLQKNAAAWEAFLRYTQCDWFGIGDVYSQTILHHFAACAASRLGQASDARRLWREALRLVPDFELARDNGAGLEQDAKVSKYPSVFDLARAFPLTWFHELRAAGDGAANIVDALTAANAFLEAMYLGGEEAVRSLVGIILQHRAGRSDLKAARYLKRFAGLPIGTKDARLGFLHFLQNQSIIAHGEAIDYWDGKMVRRINLIATEIHRDPEESDLPDDLRELLIESISLYNAADYVGAETRLMQILERVPKHAVAKGNLAAIRSTQGRHGEAKQLLRQVVADHPDYLCARCNLANLVILDGKLDEASELLKGLATRERIHIQDFFILYGSMALLNRARGEQEVADSLIAHLEQMVQNEDDARQLRFAKELQKSVERGANLMKTMVGLTRLTSKPKKPRG